MARELLVDIGNSRVKWLPVTDGVAEWESAGSCRHAEFGLPRTSKGCADGIRAKPKPAAVLLADSRFKRAWIASVAPEAIAAPLVRGVSEITEHIEQVFINHPNGPVTAAYQSMGVDRWLALQAAWTESRQACVIADCGSALTLDLIDARGVHRGGWIAAGLSGTCAGLTKLAPGLPCFEPDSAAGAARPAVDTASQIARGLILQQAATVERAWRACCLELDMPLPLLLTGGDAAEVQSILEVPSRRDAALVLKGLMVIAGFS